jgi:hypothetical protein
MGSILVGFLEQIADANGHACRPLVLCRPTPMARLVIHMTGLDRLASDRPDLPRCGRTSPTNEALPPLL